MFGSSIIDIAIGMVFVYLLLSLICSAANEIIERYSRKRASDLENGIKEMLLNPDGTGDLVERLYKHPLVYSLYAKPYTPGAKTLPSYIPARNFALALMDLVAKGGAQGATGPGAKGAMIVLRASIEANTTLPEQVKKALITFVDSSPNPENVRKNIENWFDSSMDRVSGFYKRRSQLIILLIGLALSILLNVDSIALVQKLSTERAMRDSLVAAATEYAKTNPTPTPSSSPASAASPTAAASPKAQGSPASSSSRAAAGATPSASPSPTASPSAGTIAAASPTPVASPTPCVTGDTPECRIKLNLAEINKLGLPIGWTRQESTPPDPRQLTGLSWQAWGMRILGWLITALALSLGAPFWFDMLNKFMVVRATVKPKEKSPEEASKD
jgi:hypothetical protein